MLNHQFHSFLHRQIPVLIILSIFPGLGYLFLSAQHGIHQPAVIWYCLILSLSAWGYLLYRRYRPEMMGHRQLDQWYRQLKIFYYCFFGLWIIIFLIYVKEDAYKLHYIAIFTEIGASVVAVSMLYPDRSMYRPLLLALMLPLIIYFALLGDWIGYVLSAFAATLTWVLFYTAKSSHNLLLKTQHHALHDQLTGLYNREFFIHYLQKMMNDLRGTQRYAYLLLIDLDHFKTINDSLGHDIGDAMLKKVTERLQQHLPDGHILARLGGDEFMIVGTEYDDRNECMRMATSLANDLLTHIKRSYDIERHHLYISCSIGVSLLDTQVPNVHHFIKEADIAMYEVKAKGRDGVFLYDQNMAARVERNLEIERLLHSALENDEIFLEFHPQHNADRQVIGVETLVRWNSAQLGAVSPADFIPIAEQTGLIIELGNYVLKQAFSTLSQWHNKGVRLQQFSINISIRQFMHHSFVDTVKQLGEKYLNHDLLGLVVFEVTESLEAEDMQKIISIMKELNEIGIRFSLDDFGTGYSSLSHLKQLPIDELKIDHSFILDSGSNSEAQAMVVTILGIARFLGLTVVAEGVETEEQLSFLREYRCELFQGSLFSMSLPANEFEAYYWVNNKRT